MTRFVAAIAVVIGAACIGCSSAPSEKLASTSSAECTGPSTAVVTLTGFDKHSLVLTGVTTDGAEIAIRYDADTTPIAADLGLYEPPDPCLAQARGWNQQIDRGLSQAVIERLAHFAQFSCMASIELGPGNQAITFKPVPYPPQPT